MVNGIISYSGLTTPSMVASGDLFSGTIAAEEGAEASLVEADSFERAEEELRKIEEEVAKALSHIRQGNKTNGHSSSIHDLSSFLPEARERAREIRRLVASYPLSKISPPRVHFEGGNGAGRRLIQRGEEMEPSRPYQTGDDVSRIDWNATARTGKVHVKTFRDTQRRQVLILIDPRIFWYSPYHSFRLVYATEKVVRNRYSTIEIAATLAEMAFRERREVGLLVAGSPVYLPP